MDFPEEPVSRSGIVGDTFPFHYKPQEKEDMLRSLYPVPVNP
tara:strand:+ start:2331 stop:2456 length:126 start_codon:yes stop_codon:yes gene_type:complete